MSINAQQRGVAFPSNRAGYTVTAIQCNDCTADTSKTSMPKGADHYFFLRWVLSEEGFPEGTPLPRPHLDPCAALVCSVGLNCPCSDCASG